MGKVIVIIGGQFGDEGKGAMVDFLAEKSDIVARATGGNNSGHTVVVGDEKVNSFASFWNNTQGEVMRNWKWDGY